MSVRARIFLLIALIILWGIGTQLFRMVSTAHFFQVNQKNRENVTPGESAMHLPSSAQRLLVLYAEGGQSQHLLYSQMQRISRLARLNTDFVNISSPEMEQRIRQLGSEGILVMAFETGYSDHINHLIAQYLHSGGKAIFLIRSMNRALDQVVGIEDNLGFVNGVRGLQFVRPLFVGMDQVKVDKSMMGSSVLHVRLKKTARVIARSISGYPLIWWVPYGKGEVLYLNSSLANDKANWGLVLQCISYLGDNFVSTLLNAMVFDIDDFPAPIRQGKNRDIYKEYHMENNLFYRYIWWSFLFNMAMKYDLKYTGLMIGQYNLQVGSKLPDFNEKDVEDIRYFGRKLAEIKGEIGIHGYNHNPLVITGQIDFTAYGYKPWESTHNMEEGLLKLRDLLRKLFGDVSIHTYVPPSNIFSEEGRAAVKNVFPSVKVLGGLYAGAPEKGELTQELSVDSDGMLSFPRFSSGYLATSENIWSLSNSIAGAGVVHHFIHPDDLLDQQRSRHLNWQHLSEGFESMLVRIRTYYPFLRPMTHSELYQSYQNYRHLQVYSHKNRAKNRLELRYRFAVVPVYHYLRLRGKGIRTVRGGDFRLLQETSEYKLYLIRGDQVNVDILLQ